MKLTYARAENAIAKIKLKDRLYKDISDASFFSEELSSSTMKRRSSQSNLAEDVPPSEDDIAQHETTLNTQAFPVKDLTRLERANAIAEAARLQALVKSSVWAEISAQQRLQEKEEEEELKRAVIVLQRATRNWIRKRWKVRLERQDVKVLSRLEEETSSTFITSTTTDFDEAHSQSIEAYKRSRPSSAIATSTIRPVRNTAQHPASAAPRRTVLTDGLDDASHAPANRTVYNGP